MGYETLQQDYCSSDKMMKVIEGNTDEEEIKEGVQEAMVNIKNWAAHLNRYYNIEITKELTRKYKLFFKGEGFSKRMIDWTDFKVKVENGLGSVVHYALAIGGKRIEIKDFPSIQKSIETMTTLVVEIMRRERQEPIQNRWVPNEEDGEPSTEKNRRMRTLLETEVRREFTDLTEKYKLAVNINDDSGTLDPQNVAENQVKIKLRINQGLIDTYEEIKRNDCNWKRIENTELQIKGNPVTVKIIKIIMIMRDGLEKEMKKILDDKLGNELKRKNAMEILGEQMKDENRVMYNDRKDFIKWSYDITQFIEGLPEIISDDIVMSCIKRTIRNEELKSAIQLCQSSGELLTKIAERHINDKSIIVDLFDPIHRARDPEDFKTSYRNIGIVIRVLDFVDKLGLMSRIQIMEYDVCVKKTLHKERRQRWMDHIGGIRRQPTNVRDEDKTELEKKGMIDIPAMLKRRNTDKKVEDMLRDLKKYLTEEERVVQEYKNMEERETSIRDQQVHSYQIEENNS